MENYENVNVLINRFHFLCAIINWKDYRNVGMIIIWWDLWTSTVLPKHLPSCRQHYRAEFPRRLPAETQCESAIGPRLSDIWEDIRQERRLGPQTEELRHALCPVDTGSFNLAGALFSRSSPAGSPFHRPLRAFQARSCPPPSATGGVAWRCSRSATCPFLGNRAETEPGPHGVPL